MYNKILSTLFNWIVVFGRQWMLHSDTLTLPAQPKPQFINKAMGGRLGSVQGRLVLLLWSCSKWKARVQTQTATRYRAPGQSPALPMHPHTSKPYFHFHWTVPTSLQWQFPTLRRRSVHRDQSQGLFGSCSHTETKGHCKPVCLESHFILLQQYHEKALSSNPDTFLNKPSGQAEQYPPQLPETVEERAHLHFPGHFAGLPFW